jgi:hypothetical protein
MMARKMPKQSDLRWCAKWLYVEWKIAASCVPFENFTATHTHEGACTRTHTLSQILRAPLLELREIQFFGAAFHISFVEALLGGDLREGCSIDPEGTGEVLGCNQVNHFEDAAHIRRHLVKGNVPVIGVRNGGVGVLEGKSSRVHPLLLCDWIGRDIYVRW